MPMLESCFRGAAQPVHQPPPHADSCCSDVVAAVGAGLLLDANDVAPVGNADVELVVAALAHRCRLPAVWPQRMCSHVAVQHNKARLQDNPVNWKKIYSCRSSIMGG